MKLIDLLMQIKKIQIGTENHWDLLFVRHMKELMPSFASKLRIMEK